jgi:DNA-binding NarL/FixJ family response regulator
LATTIAFSPVRDRGKAATWRNIRAAHDGGASAVCDDRGVRPTVLLVDDHADFRASARVLLEAEGFPVVGEAAGGAEALAAVRRLRPTVVLLDVQLPDIDGIEVAERLAARGDAPAVVLISGRDPRAYGGRLTAAPARGFIAKAQLTGPALAALVE